VISTEADDDCVGMVINWMGPEYVMWASDFPHPDAIYPGAADAFLRECEEQGVSEDDAGVILWDGPMAFYNLETRFSATVLSKSTSPAAPPKPKKTPPASAVLGAVAAIRANEIKQPSVRLMG